MLLPPQVSGPLCETSATVTVLGAVDGAVVQVFANGNPIGAPATAGGLSTVVPVAGLVAGLSISATQQLDGQTSPASPFPVTVVAAPAPSSGLPAPVVLSGLHPCVDWVLVGGLHPGATAEVRWRGDRAGTAVADGPVVSVPVTFAQAPLAGDELEVFQTFTTARGDVVTGPPAPALPLSAHGVGEPQAPTVSPPFECDRAVLVSGLLDGVSLTVRHGGDELTGYAFAGARVWAGLREPAHAGELLSAQQRFERCGTGPFSSPPVDVNPSPKLPTPVIVGPVCPGAAVLRVRQLRPGARISVWAEKVHTSGAASVNVGAATAWSPDCDLTLPSGWADHPQLTSHPGQLQIKVWQSACKKGSDTTSHPVHPLPGSGGTPGLAAPVACARVIAAHTLTPGAVVTVVSDQPDWPQLSGPILVVAAAMPLPVNRPLRKGEQVTVHQRGCNAGATSAPVGVLGFDGVGPPEVVAPVRIPHGGVTLRGLLTGARVHVFVNGTPVSSLDATAPEMFVPLGILPREAQVWARQSMCAKLSEESRHETATFGRLKVRHLPKSIVRGQPTQVTVEARDADRGTPVAGHVTIGALTVAATDTAFIHTFAAGSAPSSAVHAADYDSAPIAWNLVDPAPTPAPAARLHLAVQNQAPSYFTITQVDWSVERQELNGTYTLVASPTGTSAVVTPPSNGQYHVYAKVSVDDRINGGNVVAEFRGNTTTSGFGTLVVVWTGTNLSHTFRLVAEKETLYAGGMTTTFLNPVVTP